MQVCRHKKSGRCFIHIEDIGRDKARFITPEAQIKTLTFDAFEELEVEQENDLLAAGLVTEAQLTTLRDYQKIRSTDPFETVEYLFENVMSTHEQKAFIEEVMRLVSTEDEE